MTLQSSGEISLANVQTEFGGSNPIGINEYYAGGLYVPVGGGGGILTFSVVSGGKGPLYGSGAGAYPPSGWTGIQNASVDDASLQLPTLPFNFYIDNTAYTAVYIGSNSYLTFGSGSSAYFGLSASTPNIPKLMFGAADNSYQRVSTFTSGIDYVSVRYEGNANTSGTVGSPGMVVEITLFNPSIFGGSNVIEMLVGNNNRSDGVSNISNSSTAYATYTFSANSNYVFVGNSTGTSWSVYSEYFVSSSVEGVPASGTISLADFYGTSAYVPNIPGGGILGVRPDSLGVWKYTSSSNFYIFTAGYVDLLLVGGGGSGYWGYGGSGGPGGAGGLIYIPNYYLDVGTYTINIGGSQTSSTLVKDGNTILTALAGGNSGTSGGSGGQNGSALQSSQSGLSGQYGFGSNGGSSSYPGGTSWLADGGGGGAGEAGTNGSGENLGPEYGVGQQDGGPAFYSYGGKGGDGKSYNMDIDGVSRYYAGGGGGAGGSNDNATAMWGYPFGVLVFGYSGAGGLGGGGTGTGRGAGDGGYPQGNWGYGSGNIAGTNGTNGLGGGGGGGGPGSLQPGFLYHSGGSGIFIMKGSTLVLSQ